MGAMALLLGVRLAKPGVYVLNGDGSQATASDTARAAAAASRAVWLSALGATVAMTGRAAWS
jgi:adenosylcobinamide-phosphate synthase